MMWINLYDISSDVNKRFPNEFKQYVADGKFLCWEKYVNNGILWAFEKEHPDCLTWAESRRIVDEVNRAIRTKHDYPQRCLIQFWRAEEVIENSVGESRFLLTTRDQPFLLMDFYVRSTNFYCLCLYRTKMHDVIVDGDGGRGGAVGRVFRNNRMEFTPDVSYYSDKEYPQRDIAISCGIKSSLVLSWHDSSGSVVGAIECVWMGALLIQRFPLSQLRSSRIYSDKCLCGQYEMDKDSLISVVSEIKEKIGEVCKRCSLVCAQSWMLCRHCNSLSTISRCDEGIDSMFAVHRYDRFFLFGDHSNLKKGKGVVDKAAESSHNLVYCEDVAKLSITEYHLAHFARFYGLSACFAICMRSNQTGDQVYVLEFFLDSSHIKGKNIRERLLPILEIMRQLRTFKFASGGEIDLSVQVIDANSPDKVETLKHNKLDLTLTFCLNNDKPFDFLQNLERFGKRGESSRPSFPL